VFQPRTPPVASSTPLTQEQQDEIYNKANELASAGRGVEAGDLLRQLIYIKQQGAWSWQRLALLDLHGNNLERHRQDCEEMLRMFGNTNDSADAERVVKCCVITPKPVELEQASALAERLLANSSGEFAYWNKTVLGIVAIRKGSYDEALAYLTEADTLNTTPQTQARCLNQAFLSILYSRRKEPKLARVAFDNANKIMKDETEKENRTDYSYEWHNWYSCEIALKEAANLLKFPPR
jgi:tetratricopeptide (TPR) repeat protein